MAQNAQVDAGTVNAERVESTARVMVSNPLTVIALFVFLVETVATVTLVQVVKEPVAWPLAIFVVSFPVLIAVFFFVTLWWKHNTLYSPKEFRTDEAFLTARRRIERVEAQLAAEHLDVERADTDEIESMVQKLLDVEDVRSAVKLARGFLKHGEYENALKYLDYIRQNIAEDDTSRYNVLANMAYAQNQLGKHAEALGSIREVARLLAPRSLRVWHRMAELYAHYKLGEGGDAEATAKAEALLRELRDVRGFDYERSVYSKFDAAFGAFLNAA